MSERNVPSGWARPVLPRQGGATNASLVQRQFLKIVDCRSDLALLWFVSSVGFLASTLPSVLFSKDVQISQRLFCHVYPGESMIQVVLWP